MQLKKFKTKNEAIFASTDLDEYYEKFRVKINKESFDFHMKGSGWVLKKIQGMERGTCQPLFIEEERMLRCHFQRNML